MGWIEQRGRTYRARWIVDGERVSVTCATKAEARAVLEDVAAARRQGTYIDPRAGEITVEEWCDLWIESRPHVKASTDSTDRGRARKHIVGRLGRLQLAQITPLTVQHWVTRLLDDADLAPKTVRNCHGLLHSMLDAAVSERLIASNPAAGTKLPAAGAPEMHFLTVEQVQALLAAIPAHYVPLVTTLVGTGLRWGEAAGLRRRRVDVFRRQLSVEETLQEVDGTLSWGPPKTRRSRRTVSLPPTVVEKLIPLVDGPADETVFRTPRGALLRRRNFGQRVWHPAIEKANADGPVLPADLRVHDLRHTHVAQLIARGVHPAAISRRLGHASIQVTMDVYGHLLPEVDERVTAAAEAVFAADSPKSPPRVAGERRRRTAVEVKPQVRRLQYGVSDGT